MQCKVPKGLLLRSSSKLTMAWLTCSVARHEVVPHIEPEA